MDAIDDYNDKFQKKARIRKLPCLGPFQKLDGYGRRGPSQCLGAWPWH
jgi:hypothetical protein